MSGAIAILARPLAFAAFWVSYSTMKKPTGTKTIFLEGSRVDKLRNDAVRVSMEDLGADWLLFLDDDHVVPEDMLPRLLAWNVPIVGALYTTRNPPHITCALPNVDDHPAKYRSMSYKELDRKELVEVGGLGTGGMLIRREVFETLAAKGLTDPFQLWFRRPRFPDLPPQGEDLFFCEEAREAGYKIYVDPTLRMPHLSPRGMTIAADHRIVAEVP